MNDKELFVMKSLAEFLTDLPPYLNGQESKQATLHHLIDLIDALDLVEYDQSGTTFFDIISDIPSSRKRAIMELGEQCQLTRREELILRFLANGRNPSYISEKLGVSTSTVKAHKYSVFKKLGVHSNKELRALLEKKN